MADTGPGPEDRESEFDELDDEAKAEIARKEAGRDPLAKDRATVRGLLRAVPLEWLTDESPPRRYLMHWVDGTGEAQGLFPRGRVGLLAAPGGLGKSFALIDLAVAIATEGAWLEAFPTDPEHAGGRVLLAMGEEDEDEIRRRLWAAMEARGLEPEQRRAVSERVTVLPLAGTPCALTKAEERGNDTQTAFAAALEAELHAAVADEPAGWACLLLDPVSRFAGPDAETDNSAATRFVQALEGMTKLPGKPSILAAVHTNKGSRKPGHTGATNAEAVRGSSGFVDGARWVAAMTAAANPDGTSDPDRVWIGVAKSNYGKRPGVPWLVRRSAGGALVTVGPGERAAALADEATHEAADGRGPRNLNPAERKEEERTKRINALSRELDSLRRAMDALNEVGTDEARAEAGKLVPAMAHVRRQMERLHRGSGGPGSIRNPAPVSDSGADV